MTVYAKPATETGDDLWYVQLNGKYGFVPRKFVLEEKIFVASAKLSVVEDAATTALPSTPPKETPPPPTKSGSAQNINESSTPSSSSPPSSSPSPSPVNVKSEEVTSSSSEAPVRNVNEVKSEVPQEQLKPSVDTDSAIKVENVSVENPSKSAEVKVEDLDQYDSKNFDENSESKGEDDEEIEESEEGEEEDEEEEEEEYDDSENVVDSEEEVKEPVVEEPIVKKTAYVTTDSAGENSKDDVQPTLEIMAPTQSEIEKLKAEQETRNVPTTPSAVESTVSPSVPSNTASQTEPATTQSVTTTAVPIDEPQNPLNIPLETTTPIPVVAEEPKIDAIKVEWVPTNAVSDSPETTGVPITQSAAPSSQPEASTTPQPVVMDVEIPPFKPLSSLGENFASDVNDSTTDAPVVEQKVEVNEQANDVPSITPESTTAANTPSNDNNPKSEDLVTDNDSATTNSAEVVDSLEISNDSLPIEPETTSQSYEEISTQPAGNVENVNAAEASDVSNSPTDGTVIPEGEIIPPPEEVVSSTEHTTTTDYVRETVTEGVGYAEPIAQTYNKIEEHEHQHPVDNNNNLESEPTESVESGEGFFGSLLNSVKNLFGGRSTVETLVEEDGTGENFDRALNDILFSQAPSSHEHSNEGKRIFFEIRFQL